ncbi:MAG: toll/interleukin-1 receptor domain-containing protein [bacterium]|nr:toll/interleukin-1 receptor domain-containing protein [bacterium]
MTRTARKIMGKVFVSYSHKDETWKERVLTHLKGLQLEGYCSLWDDREIKTGDDWLPQIEAALKEAHIAVLLISADFLASDFIIGKEVPLILDRRQNEGLRVIPLVIKPCAWDSTAWLADIQVTPKDGNPLSAKKEHEIDNDLALLAKDIQSLFKSKQKEDESVSEVSFTSLPPDRVSISKLPVTGSALFGREEELVLLDDAWADDHTHIVTLTAWGGVGKTALVNHWLNRMERENYKGARRVYGWSFYSQGAEQGKQASADEFLQYTLTWFGDEDPAKGAAEEKGRRLAQLVSSQKTLLILDGMEPLQYPPGEVKGFDGQFKDRGMRAFLRELAGSNRGLCVISSRETVTDLGDRFGFTVTERNLEHLSTEAGVGLLESLGIRGRETDIAAAAKEYGGHALALTLLGRYVGTVYNGDIRQRDKLPALTKERKKGGHARRVMEAYCGWLGDSPERGILYIMGLFDRPVAAGAIDALKAGPVIPGLTGHLRQLSGEDWHYVLANLEGAGLVAAGHGDKTGTLDCHPLIREHFGGQLASQNPGGWQEAHKRLYHYYKELPKKKHPDTLREMEPLFAAVAHGCRAGLHKEVEIDVYWERIMRTNEHYIKKKLGAFGADLSALSHFFEVPWSRPASGLPDGDKAVILSWSAFGLRAVGRLREALQPMKAGLEIVVEQENWKQAAIHANNLSELLLTLGEVSEATDYARRSVTHADRSGDEFQKESKRASLADALHQAGQCAEAEKWFREAEAILKKRQPHYSYLYSGSGFKFCDLLLAQGKVTEVRERAEKALEIVLNGSKSLLDISLNNLTLGRAWMSRAGSETTADFRRAMEYLDRAVNGLRDSGNMDDLPRGLLARAECYRRQHQFKSAWQDLKEATEIADSGEMKLHQTDAHLLALQLCQDQGKHDQAMEHRREAGRLIEETGYFRRGEI